MLFLNQSLTETCGIQAISVRNVTDRTDMTLTLAEFIEHSRAMANSDSSGMSDLSSIALPLFN